MYIYIYIYINDIIHNILNKTIFSRDHQLQARTLCLSQMKVVKKHLLKLTQHACMDVEKHFFVSTKRGDGGRGTVG